MKRTPTIDQIIAELMSIGNGVEFCRWSNGRIVEPREVWIPKFHMWLRANGKYATFGVREEPRHFGWFAAWRLRRAIKRWVHP